MPIDCQDGLARSIAERHPVFSDILLRSALMSLVNDAFSQFLHEGCGLQSQEWCNSLGVEYEISGRIMPGHLPTDDLC